MSSQGDLFREPVIAPVDLYERALHQIPWRVLVEELPLTQAWITMYDRPVQVPRLESWHGDRVYRYGGQERQPEPWPDGLVHVCLRVEKLTGLRFDSCFANYYRDGSDHLSWYADDEPWIGDWIASVSLGQRRRFRVRTKAGYPNARYHYEWELGGGDVLVMKPGMQAEWEHCVPRTTADVGPRLNLTFRQTRETP